MMSSRPSPKFFFHRAKAIKTENGTRKVPVSSTSEDRDGDVMSPEMLESMAEQINTGHVALYADHGWGPNGVYSVFDKLGTWQDAVVVDNVLYAEPVLRTKPETDQLRMMREMFEDDTPLTFSVGFIPRDMEPIKGSGGMTFKSGDLLEISPVGIPSNPDAVAGYIKSYMERMKMTIEPKEDKPDEEKPEDEKQEEEEEKPEEEEEPEKETLTLDAIRTLIPDIAAAVVEAIKAEASKESPAPKSQAPPAPPATPKGSGPGAGKPIEPTEKKGLRDMFNNQE
jgi:hypothetical protein